MSARSLFAQAARFSTANVLAAAIGIPVWLFVAERLGPTALGGAQYVILAYGYASLIRLGTFEGGLRELIHQVARGRGDRALLAQNVGFTVDLIVSVLPGLALAAVAWTFDDPVRRIGLSLAPIAVVGSSLASFFANLHLAHGRYGLVAQANLLRQLGGLMLVVTGVIVFGPFGIVLAPLVADWSVIGFYRMAGRGLGLAFAFERIEARRLLRVGFPLGAMALVYWAYSLAGNTAAALWTDVNDFAFYVFAAAPVLLVRRALAGIPTVLTPTLWAALSQRGTADVASQARRLIWQLTAVAGVVTNLAQAGFGPTVVAAVPRFVRAIPVFEILAFDVLLYMVPMVPSLVLDSLAVGGQWRHLSLWAGALVVNMAANFAVTHFGYGILAIAWNDVVVQGLVAVALLYMTSNHLRMGFRSVIPVAAITAWTVAVWLVLSMVPQAQAGDAISVALTAGLWRVAVVSVTWIPVLALVWTRPRVARLEANTDAHPSDKG